MCHFIVCQNCGLRFVSDCGNLYVVMLGIHALDSVSSQPILKPVGWLSNATSFLVGKKSNAQHWLFIFYSFFLIAFLAHIFSLAFFAAIFF